MSCIEPNIPNQIFSIKPTKLIPPNQFYKTKSRKTKSTIKSNPSLSLAQLSPRLFVNIRIQAGAELGQAQLKLGLDFYLIFFRFVFSRFCLVQLVWKNWLGVFSFVGLIEKIWYIFFLISNVILMAS